MTAPLVSICVPTIGRAEYLPTTIRRVEEQTLRDFEVIVLDNAAPRDVVREFLEPFAKRDSRVRLERCEPRIPMFANFNRGLRAARGRYVVFFHDDDIYATDLLEQAVGVLDRHPRAAFFGTNYDFVDETGLVTEERRWIERDAVVPGRVYIEDVITRGRNLVPMPGIVFRHEVVKDGFDEALPFHFGDFVLLMRMAEGHDVALHATPLVQIRRHHEQASQSMPLSRAIPLRTQVLVDYLREYEARHPEDAGLVRRLHRRVALGHRAGLAWGWVNALDPAEAEACAEGLGRGFLDASARRLLLGLDRVGARNALGSSRVRALIRRIAPSLQL